MSALNLYVLNVVISRLRSKGQL